MAQIIETKHGEFEMIKNFKDAFNIALFNEKYVDTTFDKFTYLVGDVIKEDSSGEKLRLKGFGKNYTSLNHFRFIPDYLAEHCNPHVPFFIIRKIPKSNIPGVPRD
jgi:uncharacterized protein YutD